MKTIFALARKQVPAIVAPAAIAVDVVAIVVDVVIVAPPTDRTNLVALVARAI